MKKVSSEYCADKCPGDELHAFRDTVLKEMCLFKERFPKGKSACDLEKRGRERHR